jgi:hypothetical protein
MNNEHPLNKTGDIEEAKVAFEGLAVRLGELYTKEDDVGLTEEERAEIALILNNAMVIDEVIHNKTPWEFREARG